MSPVLRLALSAPILAILAVAMGAGARAADRAPAHGRKVMVDRRICDSVTRYVQPPGVAYEPGVDVNGNPVAPADLPGGNTWTPPKTLQFPVILNPFNIHGSSSSTAAKEFSNTQMPVAHVTVDLDSGEVLLDGKPISDTDAQAIAAACHEHGF